MCIRRPLALGSWITSVLFALEAAQAVQYFLSTARRRDSAFIKLGVALNLLADLAGTAACCATAYLYAITYWVRSFLPPSERIST